MIVEALQAAIAGADQWWAEVSDSGYALHIEPSASDALFLLAIRSLVGPAAFLWSVESCDPDDRDWDVWQLSLEGHDLVTGSPHTCSVAKSDASLVHANSRSGSSPQLQRNEPAADVRRAVQIATHREGAIPA